MELSVFLAKVLGLYLVIVAPAALLNRRHFPRLIKEFSDSLAMVVFSGFVALVLGLLLVVSHNVWTTDWRVIITLLGWLTLIKGVVRFAFPHKVSRLWTAAASSWWAVVLVAFFIIGVYLTYKGFSPHFSPHG